MKTTAWVWQLWTVTRVIAIWVAGLDDGGDLTLFYSFGGVLSAGKIPYRDFVAEYPPLALPLFALPFALAHSYGGYRVIWTVLMLAIDAALTFGLTRHNPKSALIYLAVSAPVAGLGLNRFDLLPAALTTAALLAAGSGRYHRAWALLTAGIATKVYPLALVPAFLAQGWRRRRLLRAATTGAVMLGALVLAPLVYLGNFLGYHAERGLHMESLYATPWLLFGARPFALDQTYGSVDLASPIALRIAELSPTVQLVAALGVLAIVVRQDRGLPEMAFATLLAALLTAKTLSPQYLIWLAPLFALAQPPLRRGVPFVAACGLTFFIYPFLYPSFVRGEWGPVVLVTARNLLLLLALGSVLIRSRASE